MYELQEATDADFSADRKVLYRGPATELAVDNGNGTYYYRVRAGAKGHLSSAWSQSASISVTLTCAPPSVVAVPASSANGSYRLSWVPSATEGATYDVEQDSGSGFTYLTSTGNSFIDLSDAPNGSYRYRVKAVKNGYADSTAATSSGITVSIAGNYSLAATVSGTGGGTVTSNPAGIVTGSNASAIFNGGATVTLTALRAPFAVFAGWSGACSGMGICRVLVNGDKAVSAIFAKDMGHSTFIGSGTGSYQPTIQAALNAAVDEDLIRLWGIDFTETVTLAANKRVKIKGGHNENYTSSTASTVLHGALVIAGGTVEVEGLTIMP